MDIESSEASDILKIGNKQFSLKKYASLNSTNLFLKANHAVFPDFCVVCTRNQTAGKGRFDRTWVAQAGKSLTFSIKVPLTDIPSQNWCNITQLMALSVSYVLEDMGLNPCIKWPNDVIIRDAKVSGILGELMPTGSLYTMILGVGINVSECKEDFLGLDRKATSIFLETGKEFSSDDILQKILYKFNDTFEQCIARGFESFIEALSARLYKSDAPVRVLSGNTDYTGFIMGLTNDGKIKLKTEIGIVEILSGEITSRIY